MGSRCGDKSPHACIPGAYLQISLASEIKGQGHKEVHMLNACLSPSALQYQVMDKRNRHSSVWLRAVKEKNRVQRLHKQRKKFIPFSQKAWVTANAGQPRLTARRLALGKSREMTVPGLFFDPRCLFCSGQLENCLLPQNCTVSGPLFLLCLEPAPCLTQQPPPKCAHSESVTQQARAIMPGSGPCFPSGRPIQLLHDYRKHSNSY